MAIDFKPELEEYENLTPFKMWLVNQINTWGINNFPFLENDFDQLTNYGMLMKMMKCLNDIISNENKVEQNVALLYEAFTELQSYVNNYFDNLDVQEEINNKLDAMAESGELSEIIGQYVDPYITQQNARIDSIDNKVDNIASGSPLVASSTSGMTDTTRVYVNTTDGKWYYYNGTTWTAGGTYQSTGISDGSITLDKLSDDQLKHYLFEYDWTHGSANSTTGAITGGSTRIRFYKKVWLPKGTIVKFSGNSDLNYSFQSWSTTESLPVIENVGWITTEKLILSYDAYYLFMIRYTDNSEIDDDDIYDLSQELTFYRPVYNSANQLINCYSTGKPFEIYERVNTSRVRVVSNDLSLWICFENFIEFYNINWTTVNKTPNRKIKYDLSTYGTVTQSEVSPSRDLIDVTIPTNYCLVLNVVTAVMSVKPYGDILETDALLIRSSNGYAMAGAFKDINDYWLGRMTNDINTTINYDFLVKNIAHRGYSSVAPENTLPAYQLASKNNFKYVECDVSFTSDNVPVLLHDSTIDRTSDGTGNINDLTYEQVSQYDFGSWKSEAYAGTKIPTLEEFLSLCRNLGLYPYIELKNSATYTENQIQGLVDLTEKYGMKNKVTWISFSSTYLGYVKSYDSKARLGYVVSSITSGNIETALELKTNDNEVFIDCSYSNVDSTAVNLCITNHLPLEVWTINSEANILSSNEYITGYTSNDLLAGKILYKNSIN